MASYKGYIAVDLVNVFKSPKGRKVLSTLSWGDTVRVEEESESGLRVTLDILQIGGETTSIDTMTGYIRRPSRTSGLTLSDIVTQAPILPGVLKIDFVDVQQGDAALVETPGGRVMLVDGGDNQLFARYLATRFPKTSLQAPREIDCIVITHGDADHFTGLTKIYESENYKGTNLGEAERKRLFIRPRRVFHNGLVKRPDELATGKKRPDKEMFGDTVTSNGRLFVTGLVDDVTTVSESEMSGPFRKWTEALTRWRERGDIEIRRVGRPIEGNVAPNPFDFLQPEGISVELLGPLVHHLDGHDALPFLGAPVDKPERDPGKVRKVFSGHSASHTINGHSVVFRLKYGNCRVLFAGDMNEESEAFLTGAHEDGHLDLTAEVFKVPHHGAADFSVPFLRAVSPAVSVISSGDENEMVEYIHPRATLVGGLGKHSRPTLDEPLILVTELAAFFKTEGWVVNNPAAVQHQTQVSNHPGEWFAFSRKSFGVIKVRTNGERLLVFTFSGKEDMQEAYAFQLQGERVISKPVRHA